VEAELEKAIERRFGFPVPVIVRTARAWRRFERGSPFPDAERERPNVLHLGLCKRPPKRGALEALAERATQGERIVIDGGALWIDFLVGVARSKITPALLDRAVGSPVTLRNFRSVTKLGELLRKSAS
jgi:uncharacterized protein (DUF1697 family)